MELKRPGSLHGQSFAEASPRYAQAQAVSTDFDVPRISRAPVASALDSDHVPDLAPADPASTSTSAFASTSTSTSAKKPRRKKDGALDADVKEKRARKPRATPASSNNPRKRPKLSEEADVRADSASARQADIAEPFRPPGTSFLPGSNDGTHGSPPRQNLPSVAPMPRPQSSGLVYDPVRGATVQSYKGELNTPHYPLASYNTINRASNSPSISSLIDPPHVSSRTSPPIGSRYRFKEVTPGRLLTPTTSTPHTSPPAPSYHHPVLQPRPQLQAEATSHYQPQQQARSSPTATEMDLDPPTVRPSAPKTTPPKAATPPKKVREPSKPAAAGSGLLSSALFGAPSTLDTPTNSEGQGQTVVIEVDLKGRNNVYINFAHEAEKKYGFATLHPRLALHRARQARIAAASAALEGKNSAHGSDDMSVDNSDADSNVEIGGASGGQGSGEGEGATKKVRRRRAKKEEEYDREDDFIDDAEMLWEEQASTTKDGFFVYSGPIISDAGKANIERQVSHIRPLLTGQSKRLANTQIHRSEGPTKRGGRGGRGRGALTAGAVPRGETSGRGSRGGGRGSRGGATGSRKPRAPKEKETRDQNEVEKVRREALAMLAAKPPGYSGTGAAAAHSQ